MASWRLISTSCHRPKITVGGAELGTLEHDCSWAHKLLHYGADSWGESSPQLGGHLVKLRRFPLIPFSLSFPELDHFKEGEPERTDGQEAEQPQIHLCRLRGNERWSGSAVLFHTLNIPISFNPAGMLACEWIPGSLQQV